LIPGTYEITTYVRTAQQDFQAVATRTELFSQQDIENIARGVLVSRINTGGTREAFIKDQKRAGTP
jgi:hypothetical protein